MVPKFHAAADGASPPRQTGVHRDEIIETWPSVDDLGRAQGLLYLWMARLHQLASQDFSRNQSSRDVLRDPTEMVNGHGNLAAW